MRSSRSIRSLGVVGLAVASLLGPASTGMAARAAGSSTTLTVDLQHPGVTLRPDVVGLSFEEKTVPTSFDPSVGNLATILKTLGSGNLRFGGNSLDRGTFYQAPGMTVPSWATTVLTPAVLTRLASFSRASGWTVELGADLGHTDAPSISAEAQAATSILGPQLIAIECGNEPNAFPFHALRPAPYTYAEYRPQWEVCANAVGTAAKLAGPDTIGPSPDGPPPDWMPSFIADEGSRLAMVAHHDYTIAHCAGQTATAADLLSPAIDTQEVAKVQPGLTGANSLGIPMRVDETNSASCGGIAGVSDSYAASLWGLDYTLLLAEQRVAGLNFHGSLSACPGGYSALCSTSSNHYVPTPLYYGLLMTHLMGTGQFLPVTVSTSNNVTAYAVLGADGRTTVMVVEKDATGGTVGVSIDAGTGSGTAQVLHLTGTSLSSAAGIAIQGATVSAGGTFTPGAPDLVAETGGQVSFNMATGSAALVTLPAATANPTPPGPAANPVMTPNGGGQATLTWSAPANDGGAPVTAYAVYIYGADGSTQYQESTTNSYVATGLSAGVYHTFTVIGYNSAGWGSAWSAWSAWSMIT